MYLYLPEGEYALTAGGVACPLKIDADPSQMFSLTAVSLDGLPPNATLAVAGLPGVSSLLTDGDGRVPAFLVKDDHYLFEIEGWWFEFDVNGAPVSATACGEMTFKIGNLASVSYMATPSGKSGLATSSFTLGGLPWNEKVTFFDFRAKEGSVYLGPASVTYTNDVPGRTYTLPEATPIHAATFTFGEGVVGVDFSVEPSVTNGVAMGDFTLTGLLKGTVITLTNFRMAEGLEYHGPASMTYTIGDDDLAVRLALSTYRQVDGTMAEVYNAAEFNPASGTLRSGWYVVSGTNEVGSLAVNGNASLILADGAKLSVTGASFEAGVHVSNGNSLTIWGQELGTGELIATGGNCGAGIGGGNKGTCGVITINGGMVKATGGENNAAGIGGGAGGAGGTVTINGGMVVAQGGYMSAGIGGGAGGAGGTVTINGGTVAATGGNYGVDIGAGYDGADGAVTINGGSVNLAKELVDPSPTNEQGKVVWCVTIESEELRAKSEELVEITGLEGYGTTDVYPMDGKVYLWLPNGTHVFALDGVEYGAAVKDAATTADLLRQAAFSVGGHIQRVDYSTVPTVTNGTATADFILSGLPRGTVITLDVVCDDGYECFAKKTLAVGEENLEIVLTAERVSFASVEYCDAEGRGQTAKGVVNVMSCKGQSIGDGKWYAVCGTNEIGMLTVEGEANLILMDGAKLTVTGGENQAGVNVSRGNALTIWGQHFGTGELVANGGKWGAGIGGGSGGTSIGGSGSRGGTVTINGGTVTATGGGGGAGIGGGSQSMIDKVTINGGTVTATGSSGGAYIGGAGIGGGGGGGDGGEVEINGGTVTATGIGGGAGIGPGSSGWPGTVNWDRDKVRIADGNVGKGYSYVKFVEIEVVLTCAGGEIEKDEDGEWVVTPTNGATAVTIEGLPEGETVAGVKIGGVDIPSGAFMGFGMGENANVFSLALNPEGVVTIDDKEIPVTPTIGDLGGEDAAATKPFVVGEGSAAVTVKAIPGLKYELWRAETLEAPAGEDAGGTVWGAVGEPVVAEDVTVTLTDDDPPADKAFYAIGVSVP